MKMTEWTWKHFLLTLAGWYLLTFTAFFMSEKYKDVNWIVYPCVFILIFSMLLGPAVVGAMTPLPKTPQEGESRYVMPLVIYAVCWIPMIVLARLCISLHVL